MFWFVVLPSYSYCNFSWSVLPVLWTFLSYFVFPSGKWIKGCHMNKQGKLWKGHIRWNLSLENTSLVIWSSALVSLTDFRDILNHVIFYFAAIVQGDTPEEIYLKVKDVISQNSGSTIWTPHRDQQLWQRSPTPSSWGLVYATLGQPIVVAYDKSPRKKWMLPGILVSVKGDSQC